MTITDLLALGFLIPFIIAAKIAALFQRKTKDGRNVR